MLCKDSDSHTYDKSGEWWKKYVDDILSYVGKVDFIFISHHEEVQRELSERGIPFVVVAPNNAYWTPPEKRRLIKQQWFGRYLLRNNLHIKDFPAWLSKMRRNYDEWTSIEHLCKYKPSNFFLLGPEEYLSDIINTLYVHKEQLGLYIDNV